MRWRKPLQTRWFLVGRGHLCFAILKPPCFSLTAELAGDGKEWEFAICLLFFALMYKWK